MASLAELIAKYTVTIEILRYSAGMPQNIVSYTYLLILPSVSGLCLTLWDIILNFTEEWFYIVKQSSKLLGFAYAVNRYLALVANICTVIGKGFV